MDARFLVSQGKISPRGRLCSSTSRPNERRNKNLQKLSYRRCKQSWQLYTSQGTNRSLSCLKHTRTVIENKNMYKITNICMCIYKIHIHIRYKPAFPSPPHRCGFPHPVWCGGGGCNTIPYYSYCLLLLTAVAITITSP